MSRGRTFTPEFKAQITSAHRQQEHRGGLSRAPAQGLAFVFNTGETVVQRTYPLSALGLESGKYLFDWTADRPSAEAVDQIAVTLAPHDGALLFASPSPILSTPEQLP